MKVSGIYVCVCMEYLMTLANFFIEGMAPPDSEKAEVKPAAKKGKPTPAKKGL